MVVERDLKEQMESTLSLIRDTIKTTEKSVKLYPFNESIRNVLEQLKRQEVFYQKKLDNINEKM